MRNTILISLKICRTVQEKKLPSRIFKSQVVRNLEHIYTVCLKSSANPIRKQRINKFSLLLFKIVTIRYNTRLTMFVQLPQKSGKGSCGIDRRTAVTRSFVAFTSAKVHLWWLPSSGETGRSSQESYQGSKEGDHAQLPSSESVIGTHGSHCLKRPYRETASIFHSCTTLAEPAVYDIAIGSKLPGKMLH